MTMMQATSTIQSAPTFSTDAALAIANQLYGHTGSITPLASERDQNFLLNANDGQQYVLKIANAAEDEAILALQQAALTHIQTHGDLPTVHLCPTINGDLLTAIPGNNGRSHFVRLLSYLPGRPLGEVKPHSPSLLRALGLYLGKLDQALATFAHPAANREFQWDLRRASEIIHRHKAEIPDPARQKLVERYLTHFTSQTAPLLTAVRTSIVHNDANDYNVIVDVQTPSEQPTVPTAIAGVIDFGDMVHTYTVAEPAIAAAYAMLGKQNPLAAAEEVVAGYHATHPLTETELAVLYPLITMRLCMSVCLSAHQQALQPENHYLSISEAAAWKLLETLATVPPALAHYRLRAACGLPPVPHSQAVVDWLCANQADFAPVIAQDLRSEPVLVFDLSVGSPLVADLDDPSDTATFTTRIFAEMQQAGVAVGVGRYNEARQLYSADVFAQPRDELPERRTVHIGMDLFQPAGAPIFAPLDGAVHSFANNGGYQDYGPTIILQHTISTPPQPSPVKGGSSNAFETITVPPPAGGRLGGGLTFYTLYGHLSEDSLEGLYPGKIIPKGEQFAAMGDYPINGDWPPHLHFQIITDLLGTSCGFNGVAAPSERAVWLSLCPDPNLILQMPESVFPQTHRAKQDLLTTRKERLGRNLSISYSEPLHIVRASKQFLYGIDGYAYLDVVNNVCHVGHCHPHVVRAAQRQMAVLNTNTRYVYDQLTECAERLTATLPDPLSVCFFVNSGSEANDLALRLARAYTGCEDTICLDVAYHGNLTSLIDVSPYKFDGPGGKGAPPTTHVALMPDPYRGRYLGMGRETGLAYAQHVQELIVALQNKGTGVAAFI
ncbi:MAG: aminotransferase class III-fold pyridoxal phosphate-dependent enzyme, partial [Caldilineaceae bacterium]|nr:aminotransferase class III-fold pyridoxal phosphate-dependent enzyme [Caldilineaceae bacterium]